ncbi:hypothetical protein [Psychromonas sp. Urea-02u-13]|uniref:hypothetical protein n=1 Tax=Psychromonas sp. Urea-02u-13 TaxID=2058326 RepID=UPI000C324FAA|nr:hypothetical protein [Psychromonas sp. Urea-02u-13]PKG37182.1 hypothetical protein CXF74_20205 [Psychromonas sp. Urea-02u-13]
MTLQTPVHFRKKVLSVVFATLFISACDSGSNDSTVVTEEPIVDHGDHHGKGRLAIAEKDQTLIRFIDLDDHSLLEEISTTNPAGYLYASPSGRYLTVVQRDQHLVEFIDGGLSQVAHGDHFDTVEQAPSLQDYQLHATKPTHYNTIGEQAALYFDGNKVAGESSGFYLFDDKSIEAGTHTASHTMDTSMHGTLQIRGDYVLSTVVQDFSEQNVDYNMPDSVALFELHGDHFHQEQIFEATCPGLHGSFQGENWTVFGCSDGVLAIEQVGTTFIAKKIAHDIGIGTLKGSNHQDKFLGITRSQETFLIDPLLGEITEIDWKVAPDVSMLAHATDAHQEHFMVLDSLGYLNLFDIENNYVPVQRFKVLEVVAPAADAAPVTIKHKIAASSSQEVVFITNPADNTILEVDLVAMKVTNTIQLDFTPNIIAWLGVKEEHADHAH